MRALGLALATSALLAAPAAGATFLTPSGNISCTSPALGQRSGISCTVFSESDHKGQKVWEMRRHGHVRVYHVQANAPSEGRTLGYGETFSGHGVRCTSKAGGLRCHNRDGHGFKLSRARQRVF
ncbi:MAG: hypothetical protein QOI80_2861 [Solirubrobacteraceae bacterium]|jgi:hypothetical protein|nr:hypothetical protein [Solirubrobacteraceae bacterium]